MHYVCCCKVKNCRSLVKYEDCARTNEWIHDSCEHSVPALPKKSCHGAHSPAAAAANSAHPKCERYLTAHWALKSNTPRGWWCFHCRLTSRLVGEPYQKTKSRRLTFSPPCKRTEHFIHSAVKQASKQNSHGNWWVDRERRFAVKCGCFAASWTGWQLRRAS